MSPQVQRTPHSGGFALTESLVGLTLVTLMLGCVFAMNAHLMRLLKDGKESAYATQLLQERAQDLRSALWDQVTNPEWLKVLAEGTGATAQVNLRGATEIIRVEPFDNPGNVFAQADRNASGSVTHSGVSVSSYQSVKITMRIKWSSRRGLRERSMVTVMTNGGI